MWLVTNVDAYLLDSGDRIHAAVNNCSHCSATHSTMMKSDNEILGYQHKGFAIKAQRLNTYTKSYIKHK